MRKIIAVLIIVLLGHSLVFAVEQTTSDNYIIEQPSFSGGSGSTDSSNYSARGTVGQSSGLGLESDNYSLDATEAANRQADVLPKPVLVNDNDYFDRLRVTIDKQNNPEDTKYALAISKDNFSTFSYVQKDLTIGSSLGVEDWLTFEELGETNGELITGLEENTTYTIKVAATHGSFSETRYSAESDSATTSLSYLRLSSDKDICDLGTLTESSTSSCSYNLGFSTNYISGLNITTSGSTLTVGGNIINPIGTIPLASKVGTEQFGFNAKANTIPVIGLEPIGNNISLDSIFNEQNKYAFNQNIEQATISTNSQTATSQTTIAVIANVASDTEPGEYKTTLTHTIYAN